MLHLGTIWYHSEPSDVPYSQNLPRPISWIGLFLQLYDSSTIKMKTRYKALPYICHSKQSQILLMGPTYNLFQLEEGLINLLPHGGHNC